MMTPQGRACLVVVVDDDAGIRETLADLLIDEGYEVVTASGGREALDRLRWGTPRRPCLILLDLMMPGMTGSQFYREQQRDPALASIPVCVISADDDVRNKAEALGCEFLAKPLRIEQVLDVVKRFCTDTPDPD